MASPFETPLPGRSIAPLPQRPRSSSGQPEISPNGSSLSGLSPEPSTARSSSRRHSYNGPNVNADPDHLSPPVDEQHIFQFGHTVGEGQFETFTFRVLHNVTPVPSPQIQPTKFLSFASLTLDEPGMQNPPAAQSQSSRKGGLEDGRDDMSSSKIVLKPFDFYQILQEALMLQLSHNRSQPSRS